MRPLHRVAPINTPHTLTTRFRTCCVCRTTIFMSALVCRHESRIVCMNHVDRLCSKCRMNECCLRYRYTLEDLIPLAKKLTKRTTSFEEWRLRVAEMFDRNGHVTGKRLDVSHLRELEAAWRSGRYPQCDDIRMVQEAIGRFESVAAPITEIINRKMRLR